MEEVDRRSFLKWMIFGLGSAAASLVGLLGGGYFLSPLLRHDQEGWIDIGKADGFLPGSPTKIDYIERRRDAWMTTERRSSAWVILGKDKEVRVFNPRCTHLGCPYRWNAESKTFMCPCHNGVFGLEGNVISGPPPRPLDQYPVKIVAGRLMILPQDKPASFPV